MTNAKGVMLAPGGGHRIKGGGIDATTKLTMGQSAYAATFEVMVPPGYDVGAHVHSEGEEMFYVVEGQLDVLAFEPVDRSVEDWREWESADGDSARVRQPLRRARQDVLPVVHGRGPRGILRGAGRAAQEDQ